MALNSRALLWAVYAAVPLVALQYLLRKTITVEVEVGGAAAKDTKGQEEEGQEDGEEDGMTVVDDEDATFVSLQYPKKLPKVFYKQSDPEWQEFMKFSHDRERQAAIKKELAEKLATAASDTPPLDQKLGKDIKWSKVWLDFVYPDGPSPEYARKGLLWLEDEIIWSTQTIPHSEYMKVRNIMWPSHVFGALKNSVDLLYKLQAMKVKRAMGLELSEKEKQLHLAVRMVQMQYDAQSKAEESDTMQQRIRESKPEKVGPPGASSPNSKTTSVLEAAKGGLLNQLNKSRKVSISDELTIASQVFAGALITNWGQAQLDRRPPGCFFVIGHVEIFGSQARCKMDVVAAYDPKANKYVWVSSKPKHMFGRMQSAKGGP